jgi:hypothetical protein
MYQPSLIDYLRPNAEEGIKLQDSFLGQQDPHIGILKSAARSAWGTTKGLFDFTLGATQLGAYGISKVFNAQNTFSPEYESAMKNFTASAKDNIDTEYNTQDHPITNFIASALPYAAVDAVTLGSATPELASAKLGDEVAVNALNNITYPKSFLTKEYAKNIGINEAISAQQSLTLDQKGNVHVNPTTFVEGSALGLGIASVSQAAHIRYSNRDAARIIESKKDIPVEQESHTIDELKNNDGTIKTANDEDVDKILNKYSNDILKNHKTADIDINHSDSLDINVQRLLDDDESLTKSGLFTSANAVQSMLDNGIKYNGEIRDFKDPSLHATVDNDIKERDEMLKTRGAEKVSITQALNDESKTKLDKWKEQIAEGTKMNYRSFGAIANDTGEHWLEFRPENITAKSLQKIKNASANGDSVAKKLEALCHLSNTHNLDADTKALKALQRNIILWKNGVIDIAKTYTKDNAKALDNFINKIYSNNAEYFKNPMSSGFVKLSKKWDSQEFEDLIVCLINNQ